MPARTFSSAEVDRSGQGLGGSRLPDDSFLTILTQLDGRSVSALRRVCKLGTIERAALIVELHAQVLELLSRTNFPFAHAAYVLGMNGSQYSLDTVAEKHYGIPTQLPALLCRLFRLFSSSDFTTVRIQKFSAASNFGGQHRTLAFSLAPSFEEQETVGLSERPESEERNPGHVLCLTAGCTGGFGEVRDGSNAPWRWLAEPVDPGSCRWEEFPARAWFRWHWPSVGDFFAVTVTCEDPAACRRLGRNERQQMLDVGFLLPPHDLNGGEYAESESSTVDTMNLPKSRRSRADVEEAKSVLGMIGVVGPTPEEVDDVFRAAARETHSNLDNRQSSLHMARLIWARRVLRGAAQDGIAEDTTDVIDMLALDAP